MKLMRISEVITRVSYSRSTIYAKVRAGTFPKPIKMGDNAVAWLESDIESWIRDRVESSGSKRAA